MTVTLDLTPDVEAQVSAQAQAEGLTLADYLPTLIAKAAGTRQAAPTPLEGGTARALAFYDSQLRSDLETRFHGQYVAIHPETQDYAVARGLGKAFRTLRARQPEGQIVLHHIGPTPAGLTARLRGEQPQ